MLSKTTIRTILPILILASFVFFCQGASLGMMFHTMDTIHHGQSSNDYVPTCCDEEAGSVMRGHQLVALLPSSIIVKNIFVASASIVLFFVFLHCTRYAGQSLYARIIRERYGSAYIFNPIQHLFRTGILHPKTW
jgi:hypothetical protein